MGGDYIRKEVEGFPWWITSEGEVISKKLNKPRKLFVSNCGYPFVTYTSPSGTINRYVHRLVAESFIGDIPEGYCVNHINGDKADNNVSNLEIVTLSENIQHAVRTGLKPSKYGEDCSTAKLTKDNFLRLVSDLLRGLSNTEIGEKFGLHSRYVSLIRHKRRWRKDWALLEGSTTIESRAQ